MDFSKHVGYSSWILPQTNDETRLVRENCVSVISSNSITVDNIPFKSEVFDSVYSNDGEYFAVCSKNRCTIFRDDPLSVKSKAYDVTTQFDNTFSAIASHPFEKGVMYIATGLKGYIICINTGSLEASALTRDIRGFRALRTDLSNINKIHFSPCGNVFFCLRNFSNAPPGSHPELVFLDVGDAISTSTSSNLHPSNANVHHSKGVNRYETIFVSPSASIPLVLHDSKSPVDHAAIDPSGTYLIVALKNQVYFYFLSSVRSEGALTAESFISRLSLNLTSMSHVSAIAVAPTGNFAAMGCTDGCVVLIDLDTLLIIRNMVGSLGRVRSLSFSPTKSVLAWATEKDSSFSMIDCQTGIWIVKQEALKTILPPKKTHFPNAGIPIRPLLTSMCMSSGGPYLTLGVVVDEASFRCKYSEERGNMREETATGIPQVHVLRLIHPCIEIRDEDGGMNALLDELDD